MSRMGLHYPTFWGQKTLGIVLQCWINADTYHCYSGQRIGPLPIKTHPYSILQVPTTQLAKMSIDLKFVELTADVLENIFCKYL